MSAGQTSWQAKQVVQAQRASGVQVSIRLPEGLPSANSPIWCTIFMGESGLSVADGRAAVLTPLAGRAGIRIEEVLPGQVGDGRRTELLDRFVFQVDRADGASGLQRHQKGVRAGGENMAQLGVGNKADEAQHQDQVEPPKPRVETAAQADSGRLEPERSAGRRTSRTSGPGPSGGPAPKWD